MCGHFELRENIFVQVCPIVKRIVVAAPRIRQPTLANRYEAIVHAHQASDYELLALADLFVAHGQETIAEGLIWERAGKSNDIRLDGWLKKQALAQGNWQKAYQYLDAWGTYVQTARKQKPRLPALLDELKRAGL